MILYLSSRLFLLVNVYLYIYFYYNHIFLKKILNFYLFLRGREKSDLRDVWAERKGDRESKAGSKLQAVRTEPDAGLELMNHEIMT